MCVLGCFIHLLLSATLWTDPAKFLCPRGSPGKNAGVGCHVLLQRTFPPRGRTCSSCNSCIAGRFFTTEPPGKPIHVHTHTYIHTLGKSTLLNICIVNVLSQAVCVAFIFLKCLLKRKNFNFDKVQLINFFYYGSCFLYLI